MNQSTIIKDPIFTKSFNINFAINFFVYLCLYILIVALASDSK
ncbi:MFS transporter, partial [Staphylococcus epidermidis]